MEKSRRAPTMPLPTSLAKRMTERMATGAFLGGKRCPAEVIGDLADLVMRWRVPNERHAAEVVHQGELLLRCHGLEMGCGGTVIDSACFHPVEDCEVGDAGLSL